MGAMILVTIRREGSKKSYGTYPVWATISPDLMARQIVVTFNNILKEGYYVETEIDSDWLLY